MHRWWMWRMGRVFILVATCIFCNMFFRIQPDIVYACQRLITRGVSELEVLFEQLCCLLVLLFLRSDALEFGLCSWYTVFCSRSRQQGWNRRSNRSRKNLHLTNTVSFSRNSQRIGAHRRAGYFPNRTSGPKETDKRNTLEAIYLPRLNRAYLDPFEEFSDDRLWAALEAVELDLFFRQQPDKLEMNIVSTVGLSVGQ